MRASSPVSILFASSNPHKLMEVRGILAPHGIAVEGLGDVEADWSEPIEDGDSFAANAAIKALYYARLSGRRCLADDSGLEVDALGGDPGVKSARYAGSSGPREERDRANNHKLLAALAGVPTEQRSARFTCAMCLADPDGTIIAVTRGSLEGVIAAELRGEGGFGYDPLLFIPELGRSVAELAPREKNQRSHRGAAARAIAQLLTGG